jgi:hypothetical protein
MTKLQEFKKKALQEQEELKKQYPSIKFFKSDIYPVLKFSNPLTLQELNDAYELGMLRKSELVDGKYYIGHCRNAEVALWSEKLDCFIYMRNKFGMVYAEEIEHPENDDGFDLFTPFEEVEPDETQKIPSDYIERSTNK